MSSPALAGAGPSLALPGATDWMLRPFESTRAHPAWVGLALATVVAATFVAARLLFDDLESLAEYAVVDLVMAILFGYLPTAIELLRRSTQRDFAELRPVLRGSDAEIEALFRSAVCPGRGPLLLAGLAGAALLAPSPLIDPLFWPNGRPPLTSPLLQYFVLRQAAMGFLVGRVLVTENAAMRAYARLGRRHVQVDLLDLSPLRPFARRGQRSGFAWVLCSSLVSLLWLGPAASSINGPIIAAVCLLVLVAFVVCVAGVRDSIRRAKQQRLDLLRNEIRQESDALLAPGSGGGERLASLIALQGLVERVPEWPFDAPVLLRFALLALLGLCSWLGAALVERLLDTALG